MRKIDKVYKLINKPVKWTRWEEARNNKGESVVAQSSSACRWCAIGALRKIYGSLWRELPVYEKIRKALQEQNLGELDSFNDSSTWKTVYNFFRRIKV